MQSDDVWIPIDWTSLPAAEPDDHIAVYYLVAPLLEEETGELFAKFNLYHNGFGFLNLNTNFSITINYDALNIFRATFFPEIITFDNGTRDLEWLNQGAAFIYLGINEQYWETSRTIISVINGSLYNDFMSQFNAHVNDTQPYYNMFGIAAERFGKIFLPSWDCFDYVWGGIDWLYEHGAHFTTSQQLSRDYSYFYTGTPPLNVTELYNTNNIIRNEIIDMYELFQLQFKEMGLVEILEAIAELYQGTFYLRISNDYWRISLIPPYIDLQWAEAPLPSY